MDKFMNVRIYGSTAFDRLDDCREIIIGQDDIRSLFRNFGSAHSHGDADVGPFERRRIIDAVPGNSQDLILPLESGDDLRFILRRDSREDIDAAGEFRDPSMIDALEVPRMDHMWFSISA